MNNENNLEKLTKEDIAPSGIWRIIWHATGYRWDLS